MKAFSFIFVLLLCGVSYSQTLLPKKEHKEFTKVIGKIDNGSTKQARELFNEYLNDASGFVQSYHGGDQTYAKCFILSFYGLAYAQYSDNEVLLAAKSYHAFYTLKNNTTPYKKDVFEITNEYFGKNVTNKLEDNLISYLYSEIQKVDTVEWNSFLSEYRIIELVNEKFPVEEIDSLIEQTTLNREFAEIMKKHPDFNPKYRDRFYDFANFSKRKEDVVYSKSYGGKYERKLFGTYWFDNGDKYEGEFGFQMLPVSPNLSFDDMIGVLRGQGVPKTIVLDTYSYFYGKGKYTWSSGNYFEGNFVYGKMNGFGTLYNGEKKSEVYYLLGKKVSLDNWSRPINANVNLETYFTTSIPIYGTDLEKCIHKISHNYRGIRPELYYLPSNAKSYNDYYQKYKIYRKEDPILIFNSLNNLILIHDNPKSFNKAFSAQRFNLENFTLKHFVKAEWSNDYYNTKENITNSVNINNKGYFISYKSSSSNYTRVTVVTEHDDSISFDLLKEFKSDVEFVHRRNGTKYYYSLSERPRIDISDIGALEMVTACKVYSKGFNKHLLRLSKEVNDEVVDVHLIDLNEMKDNLFKKNLSHFYVVGNNTYFNGTSWSVADVKILSDGNILTLIELEHNFSRDDPRFNFNIPQSYKEHVAILLNQNLELQGAKILPIGDHIVILENGNWVTIFNDGFRIIKYGEELNVIQDVLLGITQGNNSEVVDNVFLDNHYLYVTGVSEIKEDFAKPNPILWKIDTKTLKVVSYKVYDLKDDLKCFGVSNGLLYRINSNYEFITSDNLNTFY